jgi:hypothetical protein
VTTYVFPSRSNWLTGWPHSTKSGHHCLNSLNCLMLNAVIILRAKPVQLDPAIHAGFFVV